MLLHLFNVRVIKRFWLSDNPAANSQPIQVVEEILLASESNLQELVKLGIAAHARIWLYGA